MTTAVAPLSPKTIDDLRDLYVVRPTEFEIQDVVRFLNLHLHLVPLLIAARPVLARHFGPDTPVRLEVVIDRESEPEDGDAHLFAMVRTQLEPEAARPLLRRFDRAWWLANLRRSDHRLEFGLSYPRRPHAV